MLYLRRLQKSPARKVRFGRLLKSCNRKFQAPIPPRANQALRAIPDDAFQVRILPAYEPWMTGTLVYSEVFWQHDAVWLRDPSA